MPFGKWSGTPVQDVLVADRAYCTWLCAQPWFRADYPALHAMFEGNGAAPRATPVHNEMQLRFMNDRWCWDLARLLMPPSKAACDASFDASLVDGGRYATIGREFESRRGWDVRFQIYRPPGWLSVPILVECKTSIGDDFPEVLRQVKRRNEGDDRFDQAAGPRACVIVRAWNCQSTPWETVARLFQSEHITLVSEAWIGAA
jgi:hypothetical protein